MVQALSPERTPASRSTLRSIESVCGTSGLTYADWRGSFYPADLSKSRWFEYFTTRFDVVEVNATFYRSFITQTYREWYARTPAGFRFFQ
jgi:uncharacterized protein YecE (DUF72 family)